MTTQTINAATNITEKAFAEMTDDEVDEIFNLFKVLSSLAAGSIAFYTEQAAIKFGNEKIEK